MNSKTRIAVFGAGSSGLNAYEHLKDDHELVAFADNDERKHGCALNGYPVLSAAALRTLPVDKIVIASTCGLQIHRQLVYEEGISATKITRLPVSLLKKSDPLYYLAFFTVVASFVLILLCGIGIALFFWL